MCPLPWWQRAPIYLSVLHEILALLDGARELLVHLLEPAGLVIVDLTDGEDLLSAGRTNAHLCQSREQIGKSEGVYKEVDKRLINV